MSGSFILLNRHHQQGGLYIGRPSTLCNPFRIGEHGTRLEVVHLFAEDLLRRARQPGLLRAELARLCHRYHAGETIELACWCAPRPCHGHVIANFICALAAPHAQATAAPTLDALLAFPAPGPEPQLGLPL